MEKKPDLKYVQPFSQSIRTSLCEVKLSGSTPTCLENKIILAINLDRKNNTQFIEAIDNVLSIMTLDEQIIKLGEVFSTYGYVYQHLAILDGHLYHTEIQDNKANAKEAIKRIITDVSFSASIIQPVKKICW